MKARVMTLLAVAALAAQVGAMERVPLDGTWDFAFREGERLAAAAADFTATAWDETAVLAAVRGEDSCFNVHRGTYKMVGTDGENVWIPDEANGPHIRITEKMSKIDVAQVIDELVCRKPATRK